MGAAGRILEHGLGVGAGCRCHTGVISRRSGGKSIDYTRLSCQAGNGSGLILAEMMLVVLSVC